MSLPAMILHITDFSQLFKYGKAFLKFIDAAINIIKRVDGLFDKWKRYRSLLRGLKDYFANKPLTETDHVREIMRRLDIIRPLNVHVIKLSDAIISASQEASLAAPPSRNPAIASRPRDLVAQGETTQRGTMHHETTHRETIQRETIQRETIQRETTRLESTHEGDRPGTSSVNTPRGGYSTPGEIDTADNSSIESSPPALPPRKSYSASHRSRNVRTERETTHEIKEDVSGGVNRSSGRYSAINEDSNADNSSVELSTSAPASQKSYSGSYEHRQLPTQREYAYDSNRYDDSANVGTLSRGSFATSGYVDPDWEINGDVTVRNWY